VQAIAASSWLDALGCSMFILLPVWCMLIFMALIRWVKRPGEPTKKRGFEVDRSEPGRVAPVVTKARDGTSGPTGPTRPGSDRKSRSIASDE